MLASIFAHYGGYRSAQTFSTGMNTAVYVGAALVAVPALAAFLIPRKRRTTHVETLVAEYEAAA